MLLLATATCYALEVRVRGGGSTVGALASDSSGYVKGLLWSCVAIVGKPIISALRKRLANWKEVIGHAEQVGVTSLLQGTAAAIYCTRLSAGDLNWPPPSGFWLLMAASSALNAIIRTAETRAYAIGELSLCAPFLAFDPVMQLAIGSVVLPVACQIMGWSCDEGIRFTARHTFAVLSIVWGKSLSFGDMARSRLVSTRGAGSCDGISDSAATGLWRSIRQLRLPKGAALIILNCALYSFTYRFDRAAIGLSSTVFYFSCSRLLMAVTCILGSTAAGRSASAAGVEESGSGLLARLAPFLQPRVALIVLLVCVIDGFYMLSMYRAVSLISPVFVSAVKRGGGVLVSALLGSIFFGEGLSGRRGALLTIALGVTILCL
eukprot:CAMPEP_0115340484 /NCGR_PEP_ID=MMETSP0270-20121206/91172_1 /TAXON_ID=71861 /ORGANISM="Scrippsiella trochoidea, Strain CCMP3099" /LENGTH=376 /DNA_ID=CAMNT_0002761943 /DNA_START=1 /DNA_END=1131 /DNA_ORIENTATION=+